MTQNLEPDSSNRAGDRDRGNDAGQRQITRLLPGDDLRRLSCRRQPRQWTTGRAVEFAVAFFQLLPGEQKQAFVRSVSAEYR